MLYASYLSSLSSAFYYWADFDKSLHLHPALLTSLSHNPLSTENATFCSFLSCVNLTFIRISVISIKYSKPPGIKTWANQQCLSVFIYFRQNFLISDFVHPTNPFHSSPCPIRNLPFCTCQLSTVSTSVMRTASHTTVSSDFHSQSFWQIITQHFLSYPNLWIYE